MVNQVLDGNDCVRPCRNGATGRDRSRSSHEKCGLRGRARRNPKGDRQLRRNLVRPHRESVHRGARERRKIDLRRRWLAENTASCVRNRDRLHRKELRTVEDAS